MNGVKATKRGEIAYAVFKKSRGRMVYMMNPSEAEVLAELAEEIDRYSPKFQELRSLVINRDPDIYGFTFDIKKIKEDME